MTSMCSGARPCRMESTSAVSRVTTRTADSGAVCADTVAACRLNGACSQKVLPRPGVLVTPI